MKASAREFWHRRVEPVLVHRKQGMCVVTIPVFASEIEAYRAGGKSCDIPEISWAIRVSKALHGERFTFEEVESFPLPRDPEALRKSR